MKAVYWLLGLNRIYQTKNWIMFFVDFLIAGVALVLINGVVILFYPEGSWVLICFCIVIGTYLFRELIRTVYVRFRLRERDYIEVPKTRIITQFFSSAITQLYDGAMRQHTSAKLLQEGEFWKVYDATFNFYRQTKYGEYKAKQLYYTVFEAKLQRIVPHIIFDSKSAKGRQFRYQYLQSQRLSFEGDFDGNFDSYTPQKYHIDTLSFISPEVLQALMEMHDFDIEFVQDRLFCYGPLLPVGKLDEFKQRCLGVYAKVNDNLDSYRDDRLEGEYRKNNVTSFGRQLLRSPMKYVPLLILSGLGTITIVYFSIRLKNWELFFNQASALIWGTFAIMLGTIMKLVRKNQKLEKEFNAQNYHV
jgi:hypothetical protein